MTPDTPTLAAPPHAPPPREPTTPSVPSGGFARLVARIIRLDFQREHATPAERVLLASGPTPVLAPVAQDYAAWRRSLLLVSAAAAFANAAFQLAGFNPLGEALPPQVLRAIGASNLAIVDDAGRGILVALFVGALLVGLGGLAWRNVRLSTMLARFGWLVMFATPLILSALPFTRLMNLAHLPEHVQAQLTGALGAALALGVFFSVGPRAVALFPGIIRSSLVIKTLVPESSVPGWAVTVIAPLYVVFLWVLVTGVIQTQASYFLLGGLICLTLSPLVYVLKRRALIAPQAPGDAARVVTRTKRVAGLFGTAGLVLLTLFLVRRPNVDVFDLLGFVTGVLGNVLLLTVVGADVLLRVMRSAHEVSRTFHGGELAAALEEKLAALEWRRPPRL